MLSSRFSVAISQQGSRRRALRNVSTAAALTAAGVVAWNQTSVTKLEASHKVQQPLSSLVIPTLEATIRAQRLVLTAIMIVWDYESAKLGARLGLEQGSKEKVKWEDERRKRQKDLEEAQKIYTDESDSSSLDPTTYRELVRRTVQRFPTCTFVVG